MTPPKLQRFKEAMQLVYGPFETLPPESAATWSPPDAPGAGGHRGRYLWTDAFGVVNFITLYRETGGQPVYLTLARRLAETVHAVLGSTRDGAGRLPGATADAPLAGGLRIGKPLATGPDADGQYLHYLTLVGNPLGFAFLLTLFSSSSEVFRLATWEDEGKCHSSSHHGLLWIASRHGMKC